MRAPLRGQIHRARCIYCGACGTSRYCERNRLASRRAGPIRWMRKMRGLGWLSELA
jgi:hypothetical protein